MFNEQEVGDTDNCTLHFLFTTFFINLGVDDAHGMVWLHYKPTLWSVFSCEAAMLEEKPKEDLKIKINATFTSLMQKHNCLPVSKHSFLTPSLSLKKCSTYKRN